MHLLDCFRKFSCKNPKILHSVWRGIAPFVFLSVVVLAISLSFGLLGGIDEYLLAFRYELPFVLLVFAALLYLMRPGLLRVLVAAAPIVVLYLGMDLYYVFMSSIAKVDDLQLLPEGLTVSPVWAQLGVCIGILTWVVAFLVLFKRRLRDLLVPFGIVCLAAILPIMALMAPARFLQMASDRGVNIVPWSDRWTVALMGRATSLMLFAASKNKAMGELVLLPMVDDPGRDPALLKSTLRDPRNIHIIVLESFLDPERFKKLKFVTPPAPPVFNALRKKMHVATSPVFGGGTAQAEFEILCGVPALELYTSAEFNMLHGAKASCLPNMLADVGYRTIATQSYKPDFFNSEKAYRSIGFEEINFPTVFAGNRSTYLQYDDAKKYIFDGDLYTQNLAYVTKLLAEGQPFLNYVLGVYGHLPHDTDFKRFPAKVQIVGVDKKSQTDLAINQFYYRAEALADYLKKLRELDPKGLILVTSDHLPALDGGPRLYKQFGYSLVANNEYKENIWIYDGPEPKNIAWPKQYYAYMDFLLDVLTEDRICKEIACKNHVAWTTEKITGSYNNIMSQGAGISKLPTPLVAELPIPATAPSQGEKPRQHQQLQ